MQDCDYLGELGGLSAHRQLVMLDPRGTGLSAVPEDNASYRCDRLVDDVEAWFPGAYAALESIVADNATEASLKAIDPFFYGRWDAAARAHQAAQDGRRNEEAAAVFGAEGAFDPASTRAALAAFTQPVLLLAGEVDLNTIPSVVAELADLLPDAQLVVQPGAGHVPWLDDADRFVATTARFLDGDHVRGIL